MNNNVLNNSDEDITQQIRPKILNNFIGQIQICDNLRVFIDSALSRNCELDHVLLHGPPGLGKTTLANIISNELRVNLHTTSGPVLTKPGDLASILTNLTKNDVLFIDEIHRMTNSVEELLYSAMEDFKLDIVIGEGITARSVRIDVPHFTLVGATTRSGLLSTPLRDRFGIPIRMDFYNEDSLVEIINRSAKIINVEIYKNAALEVAKRSRGTPRIANKILRRIRDFMIVDDVDYINIDLVNSALSKLNIDRLGLDESDFRYLNNLVNMYNGGPVGIDTLSASMLEEKDTLEETIEPFLMYKGLIKRTPRGRVITDYGFDYINCDKKKTLNLF